MAPVDWSDFRTLLDAPSPAVLVTYRGDGSASASPVWFRFHMGGFEVLIAEGDAKLRHLQRRPECVLIVFEVVPPFRGVRIEGPAGLTADDDTMSVRASIAGRYLGEERGLEFTRRRARPGVVVRLDADLASVWDMSAILPDG